MGRQSAVELQSGSPARLVASASPWPAKPPRSTRMTSAPCTWRAKEGSPTSPRVARSARDSGPSGGRDAVGGAMPGKCRVVNRWGSPCRSRSREVTKCGRASGSRGARKGTRVLSHASSRGGHPPPPSPPSRGRGWGEGRCRKGRGRDLVRLPPQEGRDVQILLRLLLPFRAQVRDPPPPVLVRRGAPRAGGNRHYLGTG